MAVTMSCVDQNLHLFGICNKELACTSCSVHVLTKQSALKAPNNVELDTLCDLQEYREG